MNKNILCLLICLSSLAACKKGEAPAPSDNFNNPLRTSMDSAVHKAFMTYQNGLNTEGVSIGILKNDVMYFYGYGETKNGNATPPNKNTYFEIGSVSKTFTSIAILNMLLEKNLTIESPIRGFLPTDLPTLQREKTEVNFKHLLTHTSGLPYFPDNFGFSLYTGRVDKAFSDYDRNKLYTCLTNVRLKAVPFTSFEYSNTGVAALGNILELNYNKSYGAVIKEKILTPLGLTETTADFNETDASNWAVGYNNIGTEMPYWKTLNAFDAAGVLKSNALDMLKYAKANIAPPNTTLGKAINLTHNITYLPFQERLDGKINGRLGWFQYIINGLPNASFIWHNGGTDGFNTDLFINKANKTAVALFYNSDGDTQARRDFKLALLKLVNP
jgi:CubicO group peptidase (beta-lactamase class C family)